MDNELRFKIKVKLLEQGKTQTWLAKEIGCSKQNLSNVLRGNKNLKLEETLLYYIKTGKVRKDFYCGTN
jgi:antitoxin component HigA of HigAB toxin-antitoxin module